MTDIHVLFPRVMFLADKTVYMVTSRDQNAGRSHNMKTDNRSFEMVEEFKYLGTTITNENSIMKKLRAD